MFLRNTFLTKKHVLEGRRSEGEDLKPIFSVNRRPVLTLFYFVVVDRSFNFSPKVETFGH